MKYVSSFAIGAIVGAVVVMFLRMPACVTQPTNVTHDTIRIDTFYLPAVVPPPKIVHRTKTKIDTFIKYTTWIEYRNLVDTAFIDTSRHDIPLNRYSDSIDNDTVRLDYTIETLGFLIRFDPKLIVKNRPIVEKRWLAGVGLSDKANWKASLGYDGWLTEIEFSNGYRFNQLYVTKQFRF